MFDFLLKIFHIHPLNKKYLEHHVQDALLVNLIFENNFHQDISFKSGYEFNPFIRLKKYYASGVSEIISEENGFRFTIKINTDSLMR